MQKVNKVEKILGEIGLSDKEIKVFLYLLKTGPQKANFLARRTGIARANIYYHLELLKEKGLVNIYTEYDSTTYFKAEPVSRIKEILQKQKNSLNKKIEEVEFFLPELENLQKNSLATYPKLRFYDRVENIEDLYQEITKFDKILAVVNIDKVDEFFPKYGLGFVKLVQKKKIEAQELIVPTKNALKYQKSTRNKKHQIKLLSKSFQHQTDILIFGDNTAFISYGEVVSAFVIEDQNVTQAQREIFAELWEKVKK